MSSSTTATLTPETLESDLLAHLSSTTALEDLHSTLLCSLQRTGWTEKIRKLSLELLRAGRCERFDDVVEAVVASAEGRKHPALVDGDHHDEDNSTSTSADVAEGGVENVDVRIPKAVVEQGVRAIKEVLREIVELEDDPDLTGDHDAKENNKSHALKNGDPSPVKKSDKKSKPGKNTK
ncbi:hypothetical protein MW887_011240 [Aspergillus wentii]|nr:hypothetical protein MW887_011240 [Aspergillus wentii]